MVVTTINLPKHPQNLLGQKINLIGGRGHVRRLTLTACSTLSQNKTRPNTVHKVIQRAPASREAAMQQEKKKQNTTHPHADSLSKRRTVERASRRSGRLSSHTRDLVLIRLLTSWSYTACRRHRDDLRARAAAAFLRLDDVRQQLLHRRCELLETVLP